MTPKPTPAQDGSHVLTINGGARFYEPQLVTEALLDELRRIGAYAPEHLPAEIAMIDLFSERALGLPQVACFDTAFHRNMPRVARILPIPRRFQADGVERYGFHGLSYAYLMEELARVAGPEAALGKVVLAHLGNGASLAAVLDGKGIDTSMGFTPAAGVPTSTRLGMAVPPWWPTRIWKAPTASSTRTFRKTSQA